MADTRSPILLEFVGVPAAGKSTLAAASAARLRETGLTVRQPAARVGSAPAPVRIPTKLGYAVASLLSAPRFGTASVRYSIDRGDRPSERASLALNGLFVDGVARVHGRRSGVTVLDQGPMQAYWSVLLGAPEGEGNPFEDRLVARYEDVTGVIVAIHADDATVAERLRSRDPNPSRVDPRDGEYGVAEAGAAFERTMAVVDRAVESAPGLELLTVDAGESDAIDGNAERIAEAVRSVAGDR